MVIQTISAIHRPSNVSNRRGPYPADCPAGLEPLDQKITHERVRGRPYSFWEPSPSLPNTGACCASLSAAAATRPASDWVATAARVGLRREGRAPTLENRSRAINDWESLENRGRPQRRGIEAAVIVDRPSCSSFCHARFHGCVACS
jgi:hypothetical protein